MAGVGLELEDMRARATVDLGLDLWVIRREGGMKGLGLREGDGDGEGRRQTRRIPMEAIFPTVSA